MADLGVMELPRIIFKQHDDRRRMAAKKLFFSKLYSVPGNVSSAFLQSGSTGAAKRRLFAFAGRELSLPWSGLRHSGRPPSG